MSTYHNVERVLNLQTEDRYVSKTKTVPHSRTRVPVPEQGHEINRKKSEANRYPECEWVFGTTVDKDESTL